MLVYVATSAFGQLWRNRQATSALTLDACSGWKTSGSQVGVDRLSVAVEVENQRPLALNIRNNMK